MAKKQAFLSEKEKTPTGQEKRHLRIVISDFDKDKNAMVVSVKILVAFLKLATIRLLNTNLISIIHVLE